MKGSHRSASASILMRVLLLLVSFGTTAQQFSFESIKSYPFPAELTAAQTGAKIAWTVNQEGKRNVYVAQGPEFAPVKLTAYDDDSGQEISSLSVSTDGNWVVYVRGGDHGSNWDDDAPVNTSFLAEPLKVQIWAVPFSGGEPKALAEGDLPVISPDSKTVAFIKDDQIWTVPVDGSTKAASLFTSRGKNGNIRWSPDGARLAFVSDRGDHSFIGVFTNKETPLSWISPSFHVDRLPTWSPDGKVLAFVRTPGDGGSPDSILVRKHRPWAIWTAPVEGGAAAKKLWEAPKTLAGSIPTTHGGTNLHWAAKDRIVFLSYEDGWPHLYSMPASGGNPLLLTPGNFMAEHISLSPDKTTLLFSANTGPDPLDIDRRHAARVSVDRADMQVLTPGTGIEWGPVMCGDGSIAIISATPQRPPLPAIVPAKGGRVKLLGESMIPADFPLKEMVIPSQVVFKSEDGFTVHGSLFQPKSKPAKGPAIIYVHGGPPRQMLLGWHYSDYYTNAYATNQYLASLGFTVLAVNYRLGIGYGYEFHQPEKAGTWGASEYKDIKAAGEWLARQASIDPAKIGIYGGSYGGYLTAMALGRDSQLFAAGVDIHGVHDRSSGRIGDMLYPNQFEKAPDAELAAKIAWESSPTSNVDTWTSPVLIIHGDDDRNVRFSQSTDLVRRLEAKGVPMETMVIVDDTHHWMKHGNSLQVGKATADFFVRKLMKE